MYATDKIFVILDIFLPFYFYPPSPPPPPLPRYQPKKTTFWKNEKKSADITILGRCTINDNHMMYGSWDTKHDKQNFLSFWTIFCPFSPLTTWKIKILKKWKKMPEDIIILQMYTTNDNHMMDGSWDMEHDRQNFLSFWTNFCTLINTPSSLKNKKFEKMKITTEEVIILHMCTINDNYMMYGSWDIKCDRQNFLSFWTIFYPPNNPEKQNFEKMKKHLEILSFYKCVPKMTIIWSMFPEIYSQQKNADAKVV